MNALPDWRPLARAGEPVEGIALMARRRRRVRLTDLASGPGKLCQALAIDRSLDGIDLCALGPLFLAQGRPADEIGVSARIGITRAAEQPLRFFERGSAYLSGPKRLNRQCNPTLP